MFNILRRSLLLLLLTVACQTETPPLPRSQGLTQDEFSEVVSRISEPQGFFDSDNYISNETAYLHIFPTIERLGIQGGVYIGVGPDQNFSYIAKIRPEYAFIIDIRRGNMIQHLMYKAIFEMADTREEFLSILFSKPLPGVNNLTETNDIEHLIQKLDRLPGDKQYLDDNIIQISSRINRYNLNISATDLEEVTEIMFIFYRKHLNLRWEWRSPWRRGLYFPTYREILLGKDLNGAYGNFLNSEDDYEYLKKMHADNLIIPVVGNFAGEHALSEIAEYIRSRGDYVSAFYLSNVEYYLLPDGVMHQFAMNVKSLPINDKSILIRAFVNMRWGRHPATVGNHMMTTVPQYIESFNRMYAGGRYRTYWDVGTIDYIPLMK